MAKKRIELEGGHCTDLTYSGQTFTDKVKEIMKGHVYITLGDQKDSAAIFRDKIIRIINLEP